MTVIADEQKKMRRHRNMRVAFYICLFFVGLWLLVMSAFMLDVYFSACDRPPEHCRRFAGEQVLAGVGLTFLSFYIVFIMGLKNDTKLFREYFSKEPDASEGNGVQNSEDINHEIINFVRIKASEVGNREKIEKIKIQDWKDFVSSIISHINSNAQEVEKKRLYKHMDELRTSSEKNEGSARSKDKEISSLKSQLSEARKVIQNLTSDNRSIKETLEKIPTLEAQLRLRNKDVEARKQTIHKIQTRLEAEIMIREALERRLNKQADETFSNIATSEVLDILVKRISDNKARTASELFHKPGQILTHSFEDYEGELQSFMLAILESNPELAAPIKAIPWISEEEKRINQYEAIINLYDKKITTIRNKDGIDEEERQLSIEHMQRLKEREIEILSQ